MYNCIVSTATVFDESDFLTNQVLTETPAVTKSRLSFGFLKRLKKPVEKLGGRKQTAG